MSDCRFGVSPVNYPDPDPDHHISRTPNCLGFGGFSWVFFYAVGKDTISNLSL